MKVYYPSIFAVLAGLTGLLGLVVQSVYPLLLCPVLLLIAGYSVIHTKKQHTTAQHHTASLMLLSSASLAFGLGFQSIVPYAMLIGIALHTVCLIAAFITLGRYRAQT